MANCRPRREPGTVLRRMRTIPASARRNRPFAQRSSGSCGARSVAGTLHETDRAHYGYFGTGDQVPPGASKGCPAEIDGRIAATGLSGELTPWKTWKRLWRTSKRRSHTFSSQDCWQRSQSVVSSCKRRRRETRLRRLRFVFEDFPTKSRAHSRRAKQSLPLVSGE